MIHLPLKDFLNPPTVLLSSGALQQLLEAVQNKNGELYTTTFYRNSTVLDCLRAISLHKSNISDKEGGKCNYCESKIEHGAKLQVEHFRPKAKINPIDNNKLPHQGYYWLGLEWTNLLLSCPICNRSKGNRFPIRGERAPAHTPVNYLLVLDRNGCFANKDPLSTEEAILINPEEDIPEIYFDFNVLGEIVPTNYDTERSEISINVYKLNRPILVSSRSKVWDRFKNEFLLDVTDYESGGISWDMLKGYCLKICRQILSRQSNEEEFTLWGKYLNEKIDFFIKADIPEDYRDLFFDCYLTAHDIYSISHT